MERRLPHHPLPGLYHFPQPLLCVTKYMKHRLVLLVQDLSVLPHLQLSPLITIMMMEKLGQLAKEMYTHLLESLLVQLLAPTYHHMFTDMAYSIQSTVCVK
jgi:hypothetical protein